MRILLNFWLFLCTMVLVSCQSSDDKIRHPKVDEEEYDSKEMAKKMLREEEAYIINYLKESGQQKKFKRSQSGFWISFKVDASTPNATKNQLVEYQTAFFDVEGTPIYTEKEKGVSRIILGKTKEITAIEEALYLMGKGDEATIIFPSLLGYGWYGDEHKIPSNFPLKVNIKVLEVKNIKP